MQHHQCRLRMTLLGACLRASGQVAQEEEEEDDFPGMESGGADSDDTILGSLVPPPYSVSLLI